jgi:parallel beta helix pectate lyase-like protein
MRIRILAVLIGSFLAAGADAAQFYVSPTGDDANPGTEEQPFAALERARHAVRALKQRSRTQDAVTVWLRGGIYERTNTLELDERDSGWPDAPVRYRAVEGETVRLIGGVAVTGFEPVTDAAILKRLPESGHGLVLQSDLKAQGVTDLGTMKMRGFPQPIVPAPLELFFNNEPMTVARWPNDGWALTGEIIDRGSIPREDDDSNRPGTFVYTDDRHARWVDADDVWMFGYWCWDWADESIQVANIDTENRRITLADPHHYGLKEGMRYYAFNLLEELDQPGEWYLDRKTGMLYFWPPSPVVPGSAWVSMLEPPMITVRDAEHIEFDGLTFECMRGTGMQILGGQAVRIADCTFRNIGDLAVIFGDGASQEDVVGLLGASVFARSYQDTVWNRGSGTGHRVENCTLYNLGEGGIILGGGDRISLTPGHNAVVGCRIRNYSRCVTTNRPAIRLDGVGNRAAHNAIHDAPHTAIFFWGNDHVIEFNEIYDVCKETGDVGAIYTGRDWTMRGTTIRFNYIHDVNGPGHIGAQGIYLDDQACGTTSFGNVIVNVQRGFLIGGGRDNITENNVLVNCPIPVHMDARGLGWAADNQDIMLKRLQAVPYQGEPWRSRYPSLVNILEDEPGTPKYNILRNNVMYNCGAKNINDHARKHGTFQNNLDTKDDPGFVDASSRDYQLIENASLFEAIPEFQRIPFDKIGPDSVN